MRVLLVELKSGKISQFKRYAPLGLLKLSTWYKNNGHEVEWVISGQEAKHDPDMICFSLVFIFKHQLDIRMVAAYRKKYPKAKIWLGGPAVTAMPNLYKKYLSYADFHKGLFEPAEYLRPDYEIANIEFSYGFTSRGCPRKCNWCIVPKTEGLIKNVDSRWKNAINNKHNKFAAMDNNLIMLGPKKVEEVLSEISSRNMLLDINQAMDCRVFAKNKKIQDVFWKYNGVMDAFRFAYDSQQQTEYVQRTCDIIKSMGTNSSNVWYVLYGFKDTIEDFYSRLMLLLRNKQAVKAMRFRNLTTGAYNDGWGGYEKLFSQAVRYNPTGLVTPNQIDFWGKNVTEFKRNIKVLVALNNKGIIKTEKIRRAIHGQN